MTLSTILEWGLLAQTSLHLHNLLFWNFTSSKVQSLYPSPYIEHWNDQNDILWKKTLGSWPKMVMIAQVTCKRLLDFPPQNLNSRHGCFCMCTRSVGWSFAKGSVWVEIAKPPSSSSLLILFSCLQNWVWFPHSILSTVDNWHAHTDFCLRVVILMTLATFCLK